MCLALFSLSLSFSLFILIMPASYLFHLLYFILFMLRFVFIQTIASFNTLYISLSSLLNIYTFTESNSNGNGNGVTLCNATVYIQNAWARQWNTLKCVFMCGIFCLLLSLIPCCRLCASDEFMSIFSIHNSILIPCHTISCDSFQATCMNA